jgi:hypothetical protein
LAADEEDKRNEAMGLGSLAGWWAGDSGEGGIWRRGRREKISSESLEVLRHLKSSKVSIWKFWARPRDTLLE